MRRLRQWQRHERMTVATAVAEATHRSAPRRQKMATVIREEVELETHAGLRAQMTPPPGARPGILAEPGPQRSDRTVRRSSGDSLPQLVTPSLAGAAGEGVDSGTLAFFLSVAGGEGAGGAGEEREEEAKGALRVKQRRKEVKDEFLALYDLCFRPAESSSTSSSGRKKKKEEV